MKDISAEGFEYVILKARAGEWWLRSLFFLSQGETVACQWPDMFHSGSSDIKAEVFWLSTH